MSCCMPACRIVVTVLVICFEIPRKLLSESPAIFRYLSDRSNRMCIASITHRGPQRIFSSPDPLPGRAGMPFKAHCRVMVFLVQDCLRAGGSWKRRGGGASSTAFASRNSGFAAIALLANSDKFPFAVQIWQHSGLVFCNPHHRFGSFLVGFGSARSQRPVLKDFAEINFVFFCLA